MGIRFFCPNGHKLNVKAFQAGRRGICPFCGAKFQIPSESTRPAGKQPASSAPPDTPVTPIDDNRSAFEQDLEAHVQQAGQTAPSGNRAAEAATGQADAVQPTSDAATPTQDGGPIPSNSTGMKAAVTENAPVDEAQDPVGTQAPVGSPSEPVPPQSPADADPLSEIPDAVWYVRPISGGQFGPAKADMMRTWLNEGRVSPETLVWREGWADWQEAGSVFPEFQSALASIPASPPVAVSGSAATGTLSRRTGSRRRKSGPSTGLIVVLVVAVLLLLVILVKILLGDL